MKDEITFTFLADDEAERAIITHDLMPLLERAREESRERLKDAPKATSYGAMAHGVREGTFFVFGCDFDKNTTIASRFFTISFPNRDDAVGKTARAMAMIYILTVARGKKAAHYMQVKETPGTTDRTK